MTARSFSWLPLSCAVALIAGTVAYGTGTGTASAATPAVGLGSATSFAVLAGTTVTNTGPSVITGDVGVSPGSAIVGFPPGIVTGTFHAADAVAGLAQNDLTTAYNDAAGRTPVTAAPPDLGGLVLVDGIYGGPTLQLTGTLTLDAQGDPSSVFIFQTASTLITASSSVVSLINGADPCNVFWQIGSSATLGTDSTFVGNAMALTSISAQTGAAVTGRLLARNGATTLDNNVITAPNCTTEVPPTTTTAPTPTTVPGDTTPPGGTGAPGGPTSTVPGAPTPTVPGDTTPGGGTSPGGGVIPILPTGITLPATGAQTGGVAIGAGIAVLTGILVLLAVARRPRRRHNS